MLRLPVAATAVVIALLLAYAAFGAWGAHRKLQPLEPVQRRANYQVTLDFPPERFHQLFLQDRGRMVGVHGKVVDMMDVDARDVREIAGQYWVASVAKWPGR